MHIYTLSTDCKGPNKACRKAHREGRPVHVMPTHNVRHEAALVMPTYHYATEDEGRAAIQEAARTAPTVYADADLYLYRKQGIPHFLPVGWVDPSMRGPDWEPPIACVLTVPED